MFESAPENCCLSPPPSKPEKDKSDKKRHDEEEEATEEGEGEVVGVGVETVQTDMKYVPSSVGGGRKLRNARWHSAAFA